MMSNLINVTGAELIKALYDPAGGKTYRLAEDVTLPTIRVYYKEPVTIEAHGRTITNLNILKGGNLRVRGATLKPLKGRYDHTPAGYAAYFNWARDVSLEWVRFIDFNRGAVALNCDNFSVKYCTFEQGQDSVLVSNSRDVEISYNLMRGVVDVPTTCTLPDGSTIRGMTHWSCVQQKGVWRDGWHQDAIQFFTSVARIKIIGNRIEGVSQGIGEMGTPADKPCKDITIENNYVSSSGWHWISVYSPAFGSISGNTLVSETPGRLPRIIAPLLMQQSANIIHGLT